MKGMVWGNISEGVGNNIRVLIVHWSLTALSMAIVQHFGTIWIHSSMRFSWRGRFWMNYWLTEQSVFLYLVELVNFSSDLSFWLSSLWPSAFSASYFSCDFFFLTMRIVRRSRRVKAATAPMTIGRRRSISAPKASCLCKKWPHHFGAATNWELNRKFLQIRSLLVESIYSQESLRRSKDSKCQTLDKGSDPQSLFPHPPPERKHSEKYIMRYEKLWTHANIDLSLLVLNAAITCSIVNFKKNAIKWFTNMLDQSILYCIPPWQFCHQRGWPNWSFVDCCRIAPRIGSPVWKHALSNGSPRESHDANPVTFNGQLIPCNGGSCLHYLSPRWRSH